MPDQVELLFKFDTQGAPQLDEVSKIVEQLGQRSALTSTQIAGVESVLKSLVGSGASATQALEAVAGSSKTLGAAAANAAKDLLSVGRAAESTVPPVLAASAALRGLEGGLNIRAAERFLTQFQGINSVLQGTFQIFGALALADFAVRGVEGLVKLYQAYDPLIQAEKEYAKVAKESGQEIERLRTQELKLYLDRVAHSQGAVAGLQTKLDTPTDQIKIDAANFVDAINKVADAQKALDDAVGRRLRSTANRALPPGQQSEPSRPELAAQTNLKAAQVQLEEAEHRVKVDSEQKAATSTELADTVLQKRLDTAKAVYEQEKRIADIQEQMLALQDRATYGSGPFGGIVNAQRAADRALQPRLDDIAQRRQANAQGGPNATHISDDLYQQENSAVLGKQASDTLARAQEFVDKIHDASQKAVEDFKKVQGSAEKTAEALSNKQAADFSKDLREKIRTLEADQVEARKIADIPYQTDIASLEQRFRKSQSFAALSAPVGSTQGALGAAGNAYRDRLQLIQQISADEEHIASLAGDAAHVQVALGEARKKLVQETGEAEIDYALKVAEIQRKRLEDARNESGKVFDALVGGQKKIEDLAKSFALSQGRAIFQNVTQDLFSSTSTSLHGLIGQGSPLAGLLKGTVFEPSGTGTPIDKNTVALDTLTAMLARVSGLGGAGITGGLAGSIPFGIGGGTAASSIGLFGSDINGLTGQGPLGGGTLLDHVVSKSVASTLGQFGSGAASIIHDGLFAGVSGWGNSTDGLGLKTLLTPAQRVGNIVGSAGALATAGVGIYQGIQEGGARGIDSAVGSALGAASLIPGPQQPFVMAAALIAGMVKGLLPDPKAAFDAAQNKVLNNDRFTAPDALSGTFDVATGANSTQIATRWASSALLPGSDTINTSTQGQSRVVVQNVHFNVSAVDADSVSHFFETNGDKIAKVVGDVTRGGNPDMQIAINRVVFGPGAA